jgi:hypothetical protein
MKGAMNIARGTEKLLRGSKKRKTPAFQIPDKVREERSIVSTLFQ